MERLECQGTHIHFLFVINCTDAQTLLLKRRSMLSTNFLRVPTKSKTLRSGTSFHLTRKIFSTVNLLKCIN